MFEGPGAPDREDDKDSVTTTALHMVAGDCDTVLRLPNGDTSQKAGVHDSQTLITLGEKNC